jgi:hypothetical protein
MNTLIFLGKDITSVSTARWTLISSANVDKKLKLFLYQALEAYGVLRRRGSNIF